MKKIINKLSYYFDYYVGYFLHNQDRKGTLWTNYMIKKYPEQYYNEIKYLKERSKTKLD